MASHSLPTSPSNLGEIRIQFLWSVSLFSVLTLMNSVVLSIFNMFSKKFNIHIQARTLTSLSLLYKTYYTNFSSSPGRQLIYNETLPTILLSVKYILALVVVVLLKV